MLKWGTSGKRGIREEMPGPCGQGSENFKGAFGAVGPTLVCHTGQSSLVFLQCPPYHIVFIVLTYLRPLHMTMIVEYPSSDLPMAQCGILVAQMKHKVLSKPSTSQMQRSLLKVNLHVSFQEIKSHVMMTYVFLNSKYIITYVKFDTNMK